LGVRQFDAITSVFVAAASQVHVLSFQTTCPFWGDGYAVSFNWHNILCDEIAG
jgi:hypothetical protein